MRCLWAGSGVVVYLEPGRAGAYGRHFPGPEIYVVEAGYADVAGESSPIQT